MLIPYPASEFILCNFVAKLYLDGLSGNTAKSYLAAVRHAQIEMGFGDPHIPDMPKLEYVVKGMWKRSALAAGRPRLPITPVVLRALKRSWEAEADRASAAMLWAAACLCFFGFLRSGEVVVPSESGGV